MLFGRTSGILLHPTCLPSPFGIGDLGPSAYRFVDWLVQAGQKLWQVLPLGPTGWGNSPYMCFSAFAGNSLLVSPELLAEAGWLDAADWQALPQWQTIQASDPEVVDYETVIPFKLALIRIARHRFEQRATPGQQQAFETFCQAEKSWLDDYALFMTLLEQHEGQEWSSWDPALANRDVDALEQIRQQQPDKIQEQRFRQFLFAQQWGSLKTYANSLDIKIMGDLPIYVAYNSADVWANRELFVLDPEGKPERVAGVPPDYFSPTGQRWGNPLYDWDTLKQSDYAWWIERMRATLSLNDCVRIDHFRGFESYWAIPGEAETAVEGEWMTGPGADFFEVLADKLGEIPVIAEDLGEITPAVLALRDQFKLPGMKILLFAFGGGPDNPYLPFCYDKNYVVYTGTHDNNTAVGWFEQIPEGERQTVLNYLGHLSPDGIHWDLIRLALASVADLAILPLQDVMGLGSECRMNFPGTSENNWTWRYPAERLEQHLADKLAVMGVAYGRILGHELDQRRQQSAQQSMPDPHQPDITHRDALATD